MRARRKSTLARARDVAPVFVVIGIGVAAVFVAMNVLVTAAPVPIDQSPSPSVSALPSFPSTPSILPASVTSIPTPAQTASLPAGRPTIVNSALSASASNRAWTVYLGYPAFVEGTTPWADDIDADILGELQTRAAQWEQGPAANRQAGAKVNTLSGTFTTELLTPALASFTMTWVDDSSPSGPGTSVETLNYDLSTGQRIAFDDLFIDSSNALAVISSAAVPLLPPPTTKPCPLTRPARARRLSRVDRAADRVQLMAAEYNATVSSRVEVAPGLVIMRVAPDKLPFEFKSGQYVVLGLKAVGAAHRRGGGRRRRASWPRAQSNRIARAIAGP
jgi:hypothetical protein